MKYRISTLCAVKWIALGSVLACFCAPAESQEIDLTALKDDLHATRRTSYTDNEFEASPLFRELQASASESSLLKLVGQSNSVLVSLAAYYVINENFPASAPDAAIDVLNTKDFIGSLYISGIGLPLRDSVKAFKPQQIDRFFKKLSGQAATNTKQAALVSSFLPPDGVQKWFLTDAIDSVSMELRGIVVELLAGEQRKRGKPMSDRLLSQLRSLKTVDNRWAKMTYAVYAPEHEKGYMAFLQALLEDPDLTQVELLTLMSNKGRYVARAIDVAELNVAPKKRILIDDMSKKWAKILDKVEEQRRAPPVETRSTQ